MLRVQTNSLDKNQEEVRVLFAALSPVKAVEKTMGASSAYVGSQPAADMNKDSKIIAELRKRSASPTLIYPTAGCIK